MNFERTHKMLSDHMYMMPLDSPYYALIPKRRWYAPWRWDLRCMGIADVGGQVFETTETCTLVSNLGRDEVIGMMRLLGAINVGN